MRRLVLHLRDVSDDLDPRADALLFAAARAQHTARLILPALARGDNVVCARYRDSSLAYQGAAYGIDMAELHRLQSSPTYGTRPDLASVLLDVPVEVGLGRKRRGEWNRFEDTEGAAFFELVRAGYLRLAAEGATGPHQGRRRAGSVGDADDAIRRIVEPLLATA